MVKKLNKYKIIDKKLNKYKIIDNKLNKYKIIDKKLNKYKIIDKKISKYEIIDKKINQLSVTKIERPNTTIIFYSRLIDENNINVSKDEFLPSAKFQNIVYSINQKAG